jgi:hypothetical protein
MEADHARGRKLFGAQTGAGESRKREGSMEAPSGWFSAAKGKEVEVVLTGQHDPVVGVLASIGPDSLELRDGLDDVWVNLAAVVSVRVHARTAPARGGDAKPPVTTGPETREVTLFCAECGYERVGREPVSDAEGREAGPDADQGINTCPACGCTSWTRQKPQL